MAEPYLTDLQALADQWFAADLGVGLLECRHFFAGAAVYRDDAIVASFTPVGLAFKVSAQVRDELLSQGLAVPLRYFPTGPIKRSYVLFPPSTRISVSDAVRMLRGESLSPG